MYVCIYAYLFNLPARGRPCGKIAGVVAEGKFPDTIQTRIGKNWQNDGDRMFPCYLQALESLIFSSGKRKLLAKF